MKNGNCDRSGCAGYGDLLTALDCQLIRLCDECRREFNESDSWMLNDLRTRLDGAKARALADVQRTVDADRCHEDAVEALIIHNENCRAFIRKWLATPRPAPAETTKETP